MLGIAKKIFGSSNDRKVKDFMGRVQKINALEDKFAALSDDELRMMTDAFRDRLAGGETLDKILNEAFARAPEAPRRVLGPAAVGSVAARSADDALGTRGGVGRARPPAHRPGGRRPVRPPTRPEPVARAEGAAGRALPHEDPRRVVRRDGAHRRVLRPGAAHGRGRTPPAQRR